MTRVRCAVYTRKSSEEGLEQEFNSLDAQYDACKAYIPSQRHEGWSLNREGYDDGGISGGTIVVQNRQIAAAANQRVWESGRTLDFTNSST